MLWVFRRPAQAKRRRAIPEKRTLSAICDAIASYLNAIATGWKTDNRQMENFIGDKTVTTVELSMSGMLYTSIYNHG